MLTFLLQQASKVYALFGYLWDRVKSAALNAYSWAVSMANDALSAAKSYAAFLYDLAKAYTNLWIGAVKATVGGWIDDAKAVVLVWVNAARAYAAGLVDWLRGLVPGWIDAAKSWAFDRVKDATALLLSYQDGLRGLIDDLTSQVMPWKSLLDSLIALLNPGNLSRLTLLLAGFFPLLLQIVTSPLKWLYATISGSFVTFLCYILAQFMGTTKYTLPPPPIWLTGEGGPFPPGPPGPDPSGGELSAPLDRLYISGYHFGPGHPGLDLGLARGAAVYAMHDGEVEVAGWSIVGYGNTITLRNGKWWTRYAHLDSFGVSRGDTVKQGQKIAEGNSTGNSTGDHLHLEIKQNGVFIDPEAVLF